MSEVLDSIKAEREQYFCVRCYSTEEILDVVAHEVNNPLMIAKLKIRKLMKAYVGERKMSDLDIVSELKGIDIALERIEKLIHGLQSLSNDND